MVDFPQDREMPPAMREADEKGEEWRDLPGWERTYEVSTFGGVYSKVARCHRQLIRSTSGEAFLLLFQDGAERKAFVRELVRETFGEVGY